MSIAPTPRRGDVWLVNFDPTVGAEIRKVRPAVVVSVPGVGNAIDLTGSAGTWSCWFNLPSLPASGNSYSCIFDSKLTLTLGNRFVKVVGWYDNEWGYSNRCVQMLELLAR